VFGDYSPTAILDAIAAATATNPTARSLIEARRAEVRQQPDRLKPLLIDLLAGPTVRPGTRRRWQTPPADHRRSRTDPDRQP
jgi:hypothetical protein